jgi:hypothetical protein
MDYDDEWPRCHYCGWAASGIDHIPPLSVRAAFVEAGAVHRWEIKDVPCCKECNSALGARAPFSLVDRRKLAKAHLRRKYKRYLRMPDWREEEIQCLGYNLQIMIRKNLQVRETALLRLGW